MTAKNLRIEREKDDLTDEEDQEQTGKKPIKKRISLYFTEV
jgi:hypothetical protein